MMSSAGASIVVELAGGPYERGAAQASAVPDSIEPVRRAVALRLGLAQKQLSAPSVRAFLDAQWRYHDEHAADGLDEMRGVAHGYGIDARELFAYLHLGVIGDLSDGCTAWARSSARGPMLAKNRDFRGEHLGLQRVFRHIDPAWRGRRLLAVGSLGSPGVYSSGINSAGLALADTQVGTSDHGVGLLRYFLMTRVLARASNVDQALELIRASAHAGGGTLVLADASGAMATVELGHRAIAVERRATGFVARTNHFLGAEMAPTWRASPADPMAASSTQRLAVVQAALSSATGSHSIEQAFELMSRHDGAGSAGLCRHGQDGDARTISCAVFALDPPTLYFSADTPCTGERVRIAP